MFLLNKSIKNWFFDRNRVATVLDKRAIRALSRIGGFIRSTARNSMRRRKGASKPGQPPNAHVGTLKDQLFFGYDPQAESVVVGPVGLGSAVVPSLQEYGGTQTVTETLYSLRKAYTPAQAQAFRRKVLSGEIEVKPKPKRTRVSKYAARPFMGPALDRAVERGVINQEFSALVGP